MATSDKTIKQAVEVLLLTAKGPLTVHDLARLLSVDEHKPGVQQIETALEELHDECSDRGIDLVQIASGYRYQTRPAFTQWVARLCEEKPPRYSRALLETLALIAYRQPVTRPEIEEVRGVAVSSSTMQLLEERDWVKVLGHKETPGRPALYGTTKAFLDYFNLRSLDELPALIDLKKTAQMHPELNVSNPGSAEILVDHKNDAAQDDTINASECDSRQVDTNRLAGT